MKHTEASIKKMIATRKRNKKLKLQMSAAPKRKYTKHQPQVQVTNVTLSPELTQKLAMIGLASLIEKLGK